MIKPYFIIFILLSASFTYSATKPKTRTTVKKGESTQDIRHLNRLHAGLREKQQLQEISKIRQPLLKLRKNLAEKHDSDPTRFIDQHRIQKLEKKLKLPRENSKQLRKIIKSNGGNVIIGKSLNGKKTYTAVTPPASE